METDHRQVVDLFTEQAAAHPESVAIIETATRTCTYGELAQKTACVSEFLRTRDVSPETPVGILMSRTSDMVAVILGILKSGAAYVPIDPDDPPSRQKMILENSGCRLIIVHQSRLRKLRSVISESDQERLGLEFVDVDHIPTVDVDPYTVAAPGGSQLAYILFTSGSTGTPKGVEIEHGSLINILTASRNLLGFNSEDCILAATTIGFDISVIELFLPLVTGGRMLLRSHSCWLKPALLAAEVKEHGVSFIQTGPSTWSMLLSEHPSFPKVRTVISTAEAIHIDLAKQLVNYGDQAWNLYGPTETTVWSTGYRMTSESLENHQHSGSSVSIGHPLINTSIAIIDESGVPVKDGSHGELCIGGEGLSRGYHNDEARTRERFIQLDNERYYRTGDMATWSEDGSLLYLGRNDDEMKIRGVRIDPGEVESAILAHPSVRLTAATWYINSYGARSIIVAIVTLENKPISPQDIRDWLSNRLPLQMLPSRFVFCESLPCTPSGKIDRNALREMQSTEVPHKDMDGVQVSETEMTIMDIWQRVLQLETVLPNDSFFTIGGDSLAGVRVLTQVEHAFSVSLSVQLLFQYPVLHDFALQVDRACAAKQKTSFVQRMGSRIAQYFHGMQTKHRYTNPEETRIAPIAPDQYQPTSTPGEIFSRQHSFVEPWDGSRIDQQSLIVTLNQQGAKPGLFWCLQGQREFTQLAGHLGAEQPLHGMRSGYLIIDYDNKEALQTLADNYAAEIMLIQPAGPLVLGGNCQGGMVMRAVADKLIKEGREIDQLILMEQKEFPAYTGNVTLIWGRESHLNPYLKSHTEPDNIFRTSFPAGYDIAFIDGAHGDFFESPNVEGLTAILKDLLAKRDNDVRKT